MATDLFSQYYNNPTKSYIYTNLTCNGASADEMSFDIVDSDGVISDNENVLASLGLEGIHVPLKQYTTDMRIIGPYEILYVRGINYGASYMSKSYKLCNDDPIYEDWMYDTGITFAIRCTDGKSIKRTYLIKACGDLNEEVTFIDVCQKQLDKFKLPINVSYDNMEITFTSAQLGYEFWISHIVLWQKTVDPSTGKYIVSDNLDKVIDDIFRKAIENMHLSFGFTDEYIAEHGFVNDSAFDTVNSYMERISDTNYEHRYHVITVLNGFNKEMMTSEFPYVIKYFLYEDFYKYVPAYKYKNGAMKGCLVVPTYPIYNAENIMDYQKALRIVHIEDRVEDYITPVEYDYFNIPFYVKIIRDVVDSFSTRAEYDTYCIWCKNFKPWLLSDYIPGPKPCPCKKHTDHVPDEIPSQKVMTALYKDKMLQDYMGLYGYCNYATKHNLWMTFGAFYARTTVDDDESTDSRNLIPSFIIYNPNDFPVTVKYMTFA